MVGLMAGLAGLAGGGGSPVSAASEMLGEGIDSKSSTGPVSVSTKQGDWNVKTGDDKSTYVMIAVLAVMALLVFKVVK